MPHFSLCFFYPQRLRSQANHSLQLRSAAADRVDNAEPEYPAEITRAPLPSHIPSKHYHFRLFFKIFSHQAFPLNGQKSKFKKINQWISIKINWNYHEVCVWIKLAENGRLNSEDFFFTSECSKANFIYAHLCTCL